MKYVKILGLAAVVAAALMAFIGAGTASAKMGTLCQKQETEMCASPYTGALHAKLQAGATATLKNALLGTIDKCTESTVKGTVKNAGSTVTTASGPIEELTWGSCTCPTTTIRKGELSVEHTSGTDNGVLYGINVEVTLEGCLGLHCIFGTGEEALNLGTVTGGNPATFAANAIVKRVGGRSGAFCGSNGEWTTSGGSYEITAPKPLYISTG